MAGEDCDDRDRLRSTLRRLRQEEDEEERPDPPQRNNAGERETENVSLLKGLLMKKESHWYMKVSGVFAIGALINCL